MQAGTPETPDAPGLDPETPGTEPETESHPRSARPVRSEQFDWAFSDPAPSNFDEDSAAAGPLATLIPCVLGFLAAFIITATTALNFTPVSPYDEQSHFDYAARIAHDWHLPKVGDLYSKETVREMSCRGLYLPPNPVTTTCPTLLQVRQIAPNGVSPALGYSPVFYAGLAVGATVIKAVTPFTLFESARLTVALLFSLGIAGVVLALRRLNVPPVLATALPVLLTAVPGVVWQGSTVNSDGAAMAVGAAGVLIATANHRLVSATWWHRLLWALLVAVIAAQIKLSFVPAACFILLLSVLWPARDRDWSPATWDWRLLARRTAALAGAVLVVAITAYAVGAWRATSLPAGKSPDGGMSESLMSQVSLSDEILAAAHLIMQPLTFLSYNTSQWVSIAVVMLQIFLLGGCALLAFSSVRPLSSTLRLLAVTGLGALLLTIVMLPTAFYLMYGATGTQARYALPIIPILLMPVAMGLGRGRVMQWSFAAVAALVWVASLVQSAQL